MLNSATNIFSTTTLENDWMVIDPEGFQSNWKLNPDNTISQSIAVGSRKQGSGTLAVLKTSFLASKSIELSLSLSSFNQLGLVFNYIDNNDFSLFLVDRKGVNSDGYELKIFEVRSGTAKTICTEKYTSVPQGLVTLGLEQNDSSIVFSFTGEEIYIWDEKNLGYGQIGLYSYKSDDGIFTSLNLQQKIPTPNAGATVYDSNQNISELDKTPKEVDRDLVRFLEIQKPESKTTIDFKEVYSVPLDEYYQSILNTYELTSGENASVNTKSIVEYLDIRTKRWYRLYDDYSRKLRYAEKDFEIAQKKVELCMEEINSYLDHESEVNENFDLNQVEKDLEENRAAVAHRKNRIYKYRDNISTLLREIRTNGYDVKKDTNISAILDAGYDFQIDKSVHESRFKALDFDKNTWLGEDSAGNENWSGFSGQLNGVLIEEDILPADKYEEYTTELQGVTGIQNNFELSSRLEVLTKSIENNKTKLEFAKANKNILTLKLDLLVKDLEDLYKVKGLVEGKFNNNISTITPAQNAELIRSFYAWVNNTSNEFGGVIVTKIGDNTPDPGAKYLDTNNQPYVFWNAEELGANFDQKKTELSYYNGVVPVVTNYALRVFRFVKTVDTPYGGYNLFSVGILHLSAGNDSYASNVVGIGYDSNGGLHATEAGYQSGSLYYFFISAIKEGEKQADLVLGEVDGLKKYITALENENGEYQKELAAINDFGIHKARWSFIQKWNNPEFNGVGVINRKPIHPSSDPLAEFLIETSRGEEDINREVMFFQPTSSGFYNQIGQSLENFMTKNSDSNTVIVLPYFDDAGGISDEVIQVVRNPVPSSKSPGMPNIKLVEYYTLEVGWQGFALGELSHSFNLFPGESKELVVEKSTKKTTKISEKIGREEARKQTATSSFEDNLKNELSSGLKDSQETDRKSTDASSSKTLDKTSTSDDVSSSQDTTETSDRSWEVSAKADANWGWGSAEIKGSTSGKSSLNRNTKSSRKSTWNTSNEDAYEISKSTEGQLKSNQSTEVMRKNLSNSVKKVASETSVNNKLEFSSSSSEEYQEESSNKEVIKLENPNIGKTINYNFFQVQNIFGTATRIDDVKIVVDSGKELIDKTGINDVKVYEVEEFGKIYCNSDGSDRSAIIASIIARKVLNHYANIPPYFTSGNGSMVLPVGIEVDQESIKIIKYLGGEACKAHQEENSETIDATQMELLKASLHYLKTLPFKFQDTVLDKDLGDSRIYVNAAAYHVESQLGYLPATEEYLEKRRDIETEFQKIKNEEILARIEKGVFYRDIPGSVTSLAISDKNNDDIG